MYWIKFLGYVALKSLLAEKKERKKDRTFAEK